MRKTLAIAVLCGSWPIMGWAADDDLTVVKRAVQHPEEVRPAAARGEARWFRVRIEKRQGGMVRINLPLGFRCGRVGRPCRFRLSEALDALDAGQEFVAIEGDDARVRVWID